MSSNKPNRLLCVEFYLDAATKHGDISERDHETGDLQVLLRRMWEHLPLLQRIAFAKDEQVRETLAVVEDIEQDLNALP